MEALTDIKEGDIFYTQFNKNYYFMQIIHVAKDHSLSHGAKYKYGYFIVMFEKWYKYLPKTADELDLENIYKVKYKPKDTILYISHWDKVPEIKLNPSNDNYEKYRRYEIKYFCNKEVSKTFNPEIIKRFELPADCKFNDDGVQISQTPASIGYIYYILEQDEKYKNKKLEKINTKHFKVWLETIEPEIIKKMEKLIEKYESINGNVNSELRKCIKSINKLDEKYSFIGTIEREDIYDILGRISQKHGVNENDFEKIMEENRDW